MQFHITTVFYNILYDNRNFKPLLLRPGMLAFLAYMLEYFGKKIFLHFE